MCRNTRSVVLVQDRRAGAFHRGWAKCGGTIGVGTIYLNKGGNVDGAGYQFCPIFINKIVTIFQNIHILGGCGGGGVGGGVGWGVPRVPRATASYYTY